jgi:hypothetical protein
VIALLQDEKSKRASLTCQVEAQTSRAATRSRACRPSEQRAAEGSAGVYAPNGLLTPNTAVWRRQPTLYVKHRVLREERDLRVWDQVTKYEADGRLSTPIRPPDVDAQTVKIVVRNGVYSSPSADFVFTAASGVEDAVSTAGVEE